jgi:hypothetical protein
MREEAREMQEEARDMWQEAREIRAEAEREAGFDLVNKRFEDFFHDPVGQLSETLIEDRFWKKLQKAPYGYNFYKFQIKQRVFGSEGWRHLLEIDIFLSDGESFVMAVEVKPRLKLSDIAAQVERMKTIVQFPPAEAVGKKILGAMASGTPLTKEERAAVHEAGFFLFELRGERAKLIHPPEGFQPVEWCNSLSEKLHEIS